MSKPERPSEWYVAVMVVACTVGGRRADDNLVDLQYRLIRASDPESAFVEAMSLGPLHDHSYQNESGQLVEWTFKGLHRLDRLIDQKLDNGSEVFSTLVRTLYEQLVSKKENLWEFWLERNKHRTVRDVLGDE
jgi:hypothetical protein